MTDTLVTPSKVLMVVLHLDWENCPENLRYHATLGGDPKSVAELYNLGYYKKVGTVLGADLDDAFVKTQNIDKLWIHNQGVGPLEDGDGRGYRSTSVGDIIVLDNQPFVVRSIGFDPLPMVLKADHRVN